MSVLKQAQAMVAQSRATVAHPFFSRFREKKTAQQLNRFAVDWWKAASGHKDAFVFLPGLIKDAETRSEVIHILDEEWGHGDVTKAHITLLENFLRELGIGDPDSKVTIPEIGKFGNTTMAMWRNGDPVAAFGYHWALEEVAAGIHPVFFNGLKEYGFSSEALLYFQIHATAEQQHALVANNGLWRYTTAQENEVKLLSGIQKGTDALAEMWDGFYRHVFGD